MISANGNVSTDLPSFPTNGEALKAGAAVIASAAGTEEARFNNLNGRGVSLVAASSLITALIAVFTKDILGATYESIRGIVGFFVIAAVACLVTAVMFVTVRVLLPKNRPTFGDNKITEVDPALTTADDVYREQWAEYLKVHTALLDRNSEKARGLNAAYRWFAGSVVFVTISILLILAYSYTIA
jgi:hypothetical protein